MLLFYRKKKGLSIKKTNKKEAICSVTIDVKQFLYEKSDS